MRVPVAVIVGLLLASWSSADEARYRLPAALAARVHVGTAAGRVVAVEPDGDAAAVSVHQTIRAFAADPRYPLATGGCDDPAALAVAAGFRAPWGLDRWAGQSRTALGVVRRVVELVSSRIVADESDVGGQDAVTVLTRGRGRCSGRTNLAVGTLRSLGLPARAVHGVLVRGDGARWHRWGQVWLGELGWVEFDPGAAVGALGVRYIPFDGAGDGVAVPRLAVVSLAEAGWRGLPVSGGLRVLPVGGATVRCVSATWVVASLTGPDGSRWTRSGTGSLLFSQLLPGSYRLLWTLADGGDGDVRLEISGDRVVRVDLGEVAGRRQ